MNSAGNDAYVACNGRDGRVVWPSIQMPQLHIECAGRRPVRDKLFRIGPNLPAGRYCREAFVRAFVAAIRGKQESPAPLSAALRTTRIIEAAVKSDRTGRLIRIVSP
jgi:predicted dehydrogenase